MNFAAWASLSNKTKKEAWQSNFNTTQLTSSNNSSDEDISTETSTVWGMPSRPNCFFAFYLKTECVLSSCTVCRPPVPFPIIAI